MVSPEGINAIAKVDRYTAAALAAAAPVDQSWFNGATGDCAGQFY